MSRLTVERLFDSPSLNGTLPTLVRFAPDGSRVTYLANSPDDRNRLDLYSWNVTTAYRAAPDRREIGNEVR